MAVSVDEEPSGGPGLQDNLQAGAAADESGGPSIPGVTTHDKCPPTRAWWHTFRRVLIQLEVPYAQEGGLDGYQGRG